MPVGPSRLAAAGDQMKRQATLPNQYTVERSVEKKGKGEERVTRVIYEKRRNPEERESWVRDAGIDLAKSLVTGVLPTAVIGYGLYKLGKKRVRIGSRLPGGASWDVDLNPVDAPGAGGIADDLTDAAPPPKAKPKRPRRPKAASTETSSTVGQKTGPAVALTATGTPETPSGQRRASTRGRPVARETVDEARKAGILKSPKTSKKQATA
jgi:hypothetical protein